MGLNLNALASLTQNANPTTQPQQTVHNAPSQSTEKPNATSMLQSLAAPSGAPKDSQTKSLDSPVEVARTIKFQEVADRICSLREAIHGAHPKMPGLLQEIWSTLKSYPECVTLLEEDQMEIIISGLEKVVDTDLAGIALKSATSGKGGKSKAPVSLDSLGF